MSRVFFSSLIWLTDVDDFATTTSSNGNMTSINW